MFVTFGILTDSRADAVNEIIDSIEANGIPRELYEIIVVGGVDVKRRNTRVLTSDVCEERAWITRKKNLVIDASRAGDDDVVIVAKDYIRYDRGWYAGMVRFAKESDFDVCMNAIANDRGRRYLDWIWNNPAAGEGRNIDYSVTGHPMQFVPGCFTAAKMKVFRRHAFEEKIVGLGKQSDVEWSRRALRDFTYVFNHHSRCQAFGRPSRRYPKFRRACACPYCAAFPTGK